jgi:hypothetical protein
MQVETPLILKIKILKKASHLKLNKRISLVDMDLQAS